MPQKNLGTNSNSHPPLFASGNVLPFFWSPRFSFSGIPSNLNDILIKRFMKSFD